MSAAPGTLESVMRRAIELALYAEGLVEPNPMVGAVVVDDQGFVLGEGAHQEFGGPHAEVQALQSAGGRARGATLVVTLEPCCHQGKTPPCTAAVINAGIKRVVIGMQDPFPSVAGRGIKQLQAAGVSVEVGLLETEVRQLTAPFCKLTETGLPWTHAKWAMTLDGKIAARTGVSRWISNEASRAVVHELRGRMDAIVIGSGTALADDPLLTARPPGPRVATRVVLDSEASLPPTSRLAQSARTCPLIVAALRDADPRQVRALESLGVEVLLLSGQSSDGSRREPPIKGLLRELGHRRFTNVLVEGGSTLLGVCFDLGLIDEAHVFVAPKLLGGAEALSAMGGRGLDQPSDLPDLAELEFQVLDGDIYIHGRLRRSTLPPTGR